ncbi:hypothetical protein LEP1GSC127_2598 [Leptospira kirschneri str. 200801925]|nr:hypothetical protein LEP1GSC127_2598 [Leptospira kirschneri str. 200801925]
MSEYCEETQNKKKRFYSIDKFKLEIIFSIFRNQSKGIEILKKPRDGFVPFKIGKKNRFIVIFIR